MGTKKVELYMDVLPGQKEFYASSAVCTWKPTGFKRYKIVVEIPDPNEPDKVMEAVSVKEAVAA
jgi:hypothetical protein